MENRPCPLCFHQQSRRKYSVDSFRVITCQQCGFVFLSNPPDIEKEQNTYEDYFQSTCSQNASDINQVKEINQQRIQWIKRYTSGARLLDIGCGRGFFLHQAQLAGIHGEGVEISRSAAQYASEHYNLTVHICNLDQEIHIQETYEMITMWHVLEHFQHPVAALERIAALLKPNGKLFIEVPNLNSLRFQLAPAQKKWRGGDHPRYHRSFFTRSTLHMLLERSGFSKRRDEHIVYDTGINKVRMLPKKLLNFFYRDSFLNVVAAR